LLRRLNKIFAQRYVQARDSSRACREGASMVTAITLFSAERKAINDVATKLADIDGVSEVYSIAGEYDIAAIIRVDTNEHLADIVTKHMLKIPGIIDSQTMIAFQVFSRHDLERMFAIGQPVHEA
jgi:DNA-binding Lrp family transcriptional regulator